MRMRIEARKALPLGRVVRRAPGVQPRRTEDGNRVRIVFDTGPWDAVKPPPPSLPSEMWPWPSVTVATGESWSTVARQFGKLVDQQIAGQDLHGLIPVTPKQA